MNVTTSDGEPFRGPIVVVADESAPDATASGGVSYIIAAAAMLEPADIILELGSIFDPPRKRPFHWSKEGPTARRAMIDLIITSGVIARADIKMVGRRGQSAARQELIDRLCEWTNTEGGTHLVLEASDTVTMNRDRAVVLDHVGVIDFQYDWRTKQEPLLWIADAIAGAVSDWITNKDSSWYDQLTAAGALIVEFVA